MSRGIVHTLTFKDFLNGSFKIDVPAGCKRIQFNQFTAGVRDNQSWLNVYQDGGSKNVWENLMDKEEFIVFQRVPYTMTYAKHPEMSLLLKVIVRGIKSQSSVILAAPVGETLNLGMNGNPFETSDKVVEIFIFNEGDLIVNNLAIVLQFTFL